MRLISRLILGLTVLVVGSVGFTGIASADSAPNVSQCRNGGYANYVDPATGQAFINQGRCISVIARGGVLVPEVPPVTLDWGLPHVGLDSGGPNGDGVEHIVATVHGSAGDYPVTVLINNTVTEVFTLTIDSSGQAVIDVAGMVPGDTVTIVVNKQTFTTVAAQPPLFLGGFAYNDTSTPNVCRVSAFLEDSVAGGTYSVTWLVDGLAVDSETVVTGAGSIFFATSVEPVPVGHQATVIVGSDNQQFSATPATNCTFG